MAIVRMFLGDVGRACHSAPRARSASPRGERERGCAGRGGVTGGGGLPGARDVGARIAVPAGAMTVDMRRAPIARAGLHEKSWEMFNHMHVRARDGRGLAEAPRREPALAAWRQDTDAGRRGGAVASDVAGAGHRVEQQGAHADEPQAVAARRRSVTLADFPPATVTLAPTSGVLRGAGVAPPGSAARRAGTPPGASPGPSWSRAPCA